MFKSRWLLAIVVPACILIASRLARSQSPTPSVSASPTAVPATSSSAAPRPSADAAPSTSATALPAAPPAGEGPEQVTVGAYIHHIPQLDLRTNTFIADLYVWFKWKGTIDPTTSFELRNAVGQWQIVKVPLNVDESGAPKPDILPDGSKYQVYRIEGQFTHPFSLQAYPFDEQVLPVEIEEAKLPATSLLYVADEAASGSDKALHIPGWTIAQTSSAASIAKFDTNFGDPRAGVRDQYANFRIAVRVERPTRGLLVKTIVPLAIVILVTFVVFFIPATSLDARFALTVTALLSAVALHFTMQTDLPEVTYLVLLDKVYILSYVVILLATFSSIASFRLVEGDRQRLAKRVDMVSLVGLAVLFFAGSGLLLVWR